MVSRFLAFAVVAMFLTLGASAQVSAGPTKPGAIKVAKVEGEVTKISPDGVSARLKDGDAVIETDTVVTGKGASVVLVFMNGSSVKLAADSKLAIDEFKMDPLDEDIQLAKLDKEPSVSKTSLNLAYGEMVGNVKRLNKDSGSYYNVKTPVGAAGIRGTTFRIVFRPTGDGKAFNFTLSTAEGVVLFTGTTQGTGAPVDVPQDQEVVVTAEVDTATGQITSATIQTQGISADATAQINTAITEAITQAQQSTTFTQTEQQTAASTPPPPPPPPPPPTPEPQPEPPKPTTPLPQLTPGSGT